MSVPAEISDPPSVIAISAGNVDSPGDQQAQPLRYQISHCRDEETRSDHDLIFLFSHNTTSYVELHVPP
jgi:hypothetical protein